jgi:hypothetical protein
MVQLSANLSFSSGTVTSKILFDLLKCDKIALSRVRSAKNINIQAKNEIPTSYGKGILTFDQSSDITYSINVRITQAIKDTLLSQENSKELNAYVTIYEPQSDTLVIESDIGFPNQPEISNQANTALCASCKENLELNDLTDHQRSDVTDQLIKLMYQHWTHRNDKSWSIAPTAEIFKAWRTGIQKLKIASSNFKFAWKSVEINKQSNRHGLLVSLFYLHSTDTQRNIHDGQHHECTLLTSCPLNNMYDEPDKIKTSSPIFSDYLSIIISNQLIQSYFWTERSRLGIAILNSLQPSQDPDNSSNPLLLLTDEFKPEINTSWMK